MSGPPAGDGPKRPPLDRVAIGSRRSRLARIQADRVIEALRDRWPDLEVEWVGVVTRGDRVLDRPIASIGGKGLFTAELETALRDGTVDVAVHSLKDLPTDMGAGFAVLGYPEREDPRDVLLGPRGPLSLDDLPENARVGTSSLRRQAQLLARRPDVSVRSIRGNVETRVEKMEAGDFDAIVLAAAGVLRLGLLSRREIERAALESPAWLPAPGQGALGLEGRSDDAAMRALVAAIEDPDVRDAVTAERSLLAELEGGCLVPIGARARVVDGGELQLDAVVASPDGAEVVRAAGRDERDEAVALGRAVARELVSRGADEILARLERDEA